MVVHPVVLGVGQPRIGDRYRGSEWGMYRPDLHLGALRGPLPRSPLHVLRTYLAVTTLLYAVGVALTLFPTDDSATLSDPTGGLVAVVLGLAALG